MKNDALRLLWSIIVAETIETARTGSELQLNRLPPKYWTWMTQALGQVFKAGLVGASYRVV